MKTKPHEDPHCSCAPCEKWRQWVEGEEDGWRPPNADDDPSYPYDDPFATAPRELLSNEVFRIGDPVYLNAEGLATHDPSGVFAGYALTFSVKE